MDALLALKIAGTLLGVFGAVVAAASDLTEGERKKRWTVMGIAVGLIGGGIALGTLLYEQRESAEGAKKELERHGEQLAAIEKVLVETQRQLSPLNPSRVDVGLRIPNENVSRAGGGIELSDGGNEVQKDELAFRTQVYVFLQAGPIASQAVDLDDNAKIADLQFRAVVRRDATASGMSSDDRGLVAWFASYAVDPGEQWSTTRKIVSTRDLPGSRIIVQLGTNGDADGKLRRILSASGFRRIIIRFDTLQLRLPIDRGRVFEKGGDKWFVYDFPGTYEEVLALQE